MSYKKNKIANKTSDSSESLFISNYKLHYLVLFFLAILLYGWTTTFDFGFDDEYIIQTLTQYGHSISEFPKIITLKFGYYDYRPIPIFSFWIEKLLFKQIIPSVAHIINIFLFAFLLTRIYKLTSLFSVFTNKNSQLLFIAITCLVFLVHPNHVSVVANIKSRDNILSMLFGTMAAIQACSYIINKKWWQIPLSILLFLLGLFSKADAYGFMIIPFLFIVIFYNNSLKIKIRLILIGIFLFAIVWILRKIILNIMTTTEFNIRIISDNPLQSNSSFFDALSLASTSLLYYLKFLLIPNGYYFYFGENQLTLLSLFHPLNLLSIALFIAISIFCLTQYKKQKMYLFAWLFFLFSILYALNFFVLISGIIMDRYNFIPSLGFAWMIAAIIIEINTKNNIFQFKHKWILLIFVIWIMATYLRTADWKNKQTLFTADIDKLQQSAHANFLMGSYYINEVLFNKVDVINRNEYVILGEKYIDRSLAIKPNVTTALEGKGTCEILKDSNRLAIHYFEKCFQLDTNYISCVNFKGNAYKNLNMLDSAYYCYKYVADRQNYFGFAADNLMSLLFNNNRAEEGNKMLEYFLNKFPNDPLLQERYQQFEINKYNKRKENNL